MSTSTPTTPTDPAEPASATALRRTDGNAGEPTSAPGTAEPRPTPAPGGFRKRLGLRLAAVGLLGVVSVVMWRAMIGHATSPNKTVPAAILPVAVAPVTRADLYNEVTIPAEFRPYVEVELHAKVSGYLDKMNVDFGDRVKAGQLLATLDAPDLVAELNSALAALRHAEADYTNAHVIYGRMLNVNREHPDLVAQQELDTAAAKDQETAAAIAAAQADMEKFKTLVNYTKITAPFDGVITRRYVDPGALIQAGTGSAQTLPLVRLSDNYRLRLDFPVSVAYVKDIHVGDPVEVRAESLGGKTLAGKITRATFKVEEATRTMLTEIEVPNPDLQLVPGMYASVLLKVERRPNVLTIPPEAVAGGKKSSVYLVDQNGEIEERPVTLGLETPDRYEVLSGLKEGDQVMVGSRSEVRPGQKVEGKLIGSLAHP